MVGVGSRARMENTRQNQPMKHLWRPRIDNAWEGGELGIPIPKPLSARPSTHFNFRNQWQPLLTQIWTDLTCSMSHFNSNESIGAQCFHYVLLTVSWKLVCLYKSSSRVLSPYLCFVTLLQILCFSIHWGILRMYTDDDVTLIRVRFFLKLL